MKKLDDQAQRSPQSRRRHRGGWKNAASQSARPWTDMLERTLPNWGRRHAATIRPAPKCNALARANAPQLATGA
eukprot:1079318-Alexandrium_andersonii.AAC.1